MSDTQNIQWFPGHMAKTKRKIQENLKLVDAVVEIADARIPRSSRNPDLDEIITAKPRVLLLNKSDMADPTMTSKWLSFYNNLALPAIALECKSGKGLSKFTPFIKNVLHEKITSFKQKGFLNKSLRLMIVGIPNVGKSSLINRLTRQNKAKTEDRPGVTRGNQWFSVGKNLELLDTPGVLWPKFEDPEVGQKLAFYGSIKDNIFDSEELARNLIDTLKSSYPNALHTRYNLDLDITTSSPHEILRQIAFKRGMFISGGNLDTERAAITILDEFRAAKLGRFTLDTI